MKAHTAHYLKEKTEKVVRRLKMSDFWVKNEREGDQKKKGHNIAVQNKEVASV